MKSEKQKRKTPKIKEYPKGIREPKNRQWSQAKSINTRSKLE